MLKTESIKLRVAAKEDCDDLFSWANDLETRKASFTSSKINYKSHCKWFQKSLKSRQRVIFIGLDKEDNKIGVVRFDKVSAYAAEVSVNIAPNMRGKGYAAQLIRSSCRFCSFAGIRFFIARIKKQHNISIKVFKKAGFCELFDYKNDLCLDIMVMIMMRKRARA